MSGRQSAPNGGYGWTIVVASFFTMALVAQPMSTFGLFMGELVLFHDVSHLTIAWVGSINLSFGPIMGVLIGPTVHLLGCRWVAIGGSLLSAAGYILAGQVHHIVALYIGFGFIVGAGISCCYNCAMVSVQLYFTTRRALAASIVTMGLSFGSFIWPPICRLLIDMYGWGGAMFIFGAVQLHGIALGSLMVAPPVATFGTTVIHNENRKNIFSSCRSMFDFSLLRNVAFSLYMLATFFVFLGHLIPYVYLPVHGAKQGYNKHASAFLVSILAICGGLFRLVFGWLGDKRFTNRTFMYSVSALGAGLALVVSIFATSYYQSAIIAGIIGTFAAGYIALCGPVIVDIIGVENVAKGSGLYMMAMGFGNLISQATAGVILDAATDIRIVFLVFGALEAAGGFCALAAYIHQCRVGRNPPHMTDADIDVDTKC